MRSLSIPQPPEILLRFSFQHPPLFLVISFKIRQELRQSILEEKHYIHTKPLIISTHHESSWKPTETSWGQKCSTASPFRLNTKTRFGRSHCDTLTLNMGRSFLRVWKWPPPGTVAFLSCVKNGRETNRKKGAIWGLFYGKRWPVHSERAKTPRYCWTAGTSESEDIKCFWCYMQLCGYLM